MRETVSQDPAQFDLLVAEVMVPVQRFKALLEEASVRDALAAIDFRIVLPNLIPIPSLNAGPIVGARSRRLSQRSLRLAEGKLTPI